MNKNNILVCITNHNSNENAINLKNSFSEYFETIIIDSDSNIIEKDFDIKLENVYYTGLVNESVNQCKLRNKKYLFFIASDVYYEDSGDIGIHMWYTRQWNSEMDVWGMKNIDRYNKIKVFK